uniref:LRA-17 n=1 Tax=uncultured bacterium BLR17 TaxID=506517 RepID=B5L5V9_9BACT|nr:LRA17 family subclass B3 metallo-beta-lactamase [uncultured bacterium BLR17]ACH58994.1 LRA-17 [uncultured bacterium BLR17]
MSIFRTILFVSILLLTSLANSPHATAQVTNTDRPEWSKPYKPFRIAGNIYYVGTYDLACYLITTPQGHILINAALAGTVDQVKANVEALGFKFSDIKILLISQAHFDHVGGLAAIQKMTGAKVMIDDQDAPVVEDGGNSDYIYGGKGVGSLFAPVHVDRKLHDHDNITLGGTQLEMLHHPGHTKGSCSYLLTVKDEHRSYRVLIANIPYMLSEVTLPGMPTYPNVGKDFMYTYGAMRKLQFDIWVAAHSSQFGLQDVRKETDGYNPGAFGDKKKYLTTIDKTEDIYKEHFKGGK